MDEQFSQETKNLIAESRLIAINLGYDYISTIHFFLADCKLKDKYTIKNFAFKTDEVFQSFINSQKIAEPNIFAETLPLTVEAEQTVRKAFMLWNNSEYRDDKIRPYHLFIAASRLKNTLFYSILEPKEGLQERIEQYFIGVGQINKTNIHKSFWAKLTKKISA